MFVTLLAKGYLNINTKECNEEKETRSNKNYVEKYDKTT